VTSRRSQRGRPSAARRRAARQAAAAAGVQQLFFQQSSQPPIQRQATATVAQPGRSSQAGQASNHSSQPLQPSHSSNSSSLQRGRQPSASRRPRDRAPLASIPLPQGQAQRPTQHRQQQQQQQLQQKSRKRGRSSNTGPTPPARRAPTTQPQGAGMVASTARKPTITASMLPSDDWWISDGRVYFQGNGYSSSCPAQLPCEKVLSNKKIAHPVRPTLVVNNLIVPYLPEPCQDMDPVMRNNPWMFLKPRLVKCSHGLLSGNDCSCAVLGLAGQFHRPSVLPDVCIKNQFLKPRDFTVEMTEFHTQENPSRVYVRRPEKQDHVLSLPTPFPISGAWRSRYYEPAMANVEEDDRLRLYYALYDSQRFREIGKTYLKEPCYWSPEEHPTFFEPIREVGNLCANLYGVETLQRTGLCSHPCAEPRVYLYIAVSPADRKVPVYVTDRSRPLRLDTVIANAIRPWYEKGHGKILCPVCLVQTSARGTSLEFFSRSEYVSHWEICHAPDMAAVTTFSATQLNTRIHMGHVAYVLAVANLHSIQEAPSESAICSAALKNYGVTEYSDILADFLGPVSLDDFEAICNDMLGPSVQDAPLQESEGSG